MEVKLAELLPLLNFLWLPFVFIATSISKKNKELKGYIDKKAESIDKLISEQVEQASERIALIDAAVRELQKTSQKCVDEKFVRDLYESMFGKEVDPIKQDLKEVAISINRSMREFDEKVHLLALDIAKKGRVGNE